MDEPKPQAQTQPLPPDGPSTLQLSGAIERLMDERLYDEAAIRFARLLPPDQADILENLSNEHLAALIDRLSLKALAQATEELDTGAAVEVSRTIPDGMLPELLDEISPDVAADVLRALPQDVADTALKSMEAAAEVAPLMAYEDDDAGGLMTPEFIAIQENVTVSQAMSFIRAWAEEFGSADVSQVFIVDDDGVMTGTASLSQLVLARPFQYVSLIMNRDVISVGTETDQEEVARIMERYDIHSLPVIDDSNRIVGMVVIDDIIDVFEDEATEDMFRMIGVDEGERALGPFWRSVRSRLPWLCVNLATAIAAGLIITLYESTLTRAIALAAFLPVIAGQGGIAGTQTLTLIVRSIALGELATGNAKRLLLKELGLGLVHGIVVGLLVGGIAFAWRGNPWFALVAGVAMMANMMVAGISGVLVPLGFRALKIDPALGSAVAVTTATDVIGFFIYLGLATLMITLIVPG
ncbi:MAG: magnesium transporter [Chloroflexi bacterium]|nr:magnesium transporter [Chloroflexota bacterium]